MVFFQCVFLDICSEGLGEGYDGDIAFASTLETFGGGHNDPISVAFGGMYGTYMFLLAKIDVITLLVSDFVGFVSCCRNSCNF